MLKIQGQPKVWMGDVISAIAGTATATTGTITGASKAAACVITDVAHGLDTGDVVGISAVVGMVELNGLEAVITKLTADTFSIPVDSQAFTTYTSAGTWTLMETDEGTVTLTMDGQEILLEGLADWSAVAVGDYCISPVTVLAVTGAADWEIVSAATFAKYLIAQGG